MFMMVEHRVIKMLLSLFDWADGDGIFAPGEEEERTRWQVRRGEGGGGGKRYGRKKKEKDMILKLVYGMEES